MMRPYRPQNHPDCSEPSLPPAKDARQSESSKQKKSKPESVKRFLRDNGLSLVLLALFVSFLAGQLISGWLNYNEEQEEHQQAQIGFRQYLGTGACGEAVFENWESEFLQMCLYVLLTVFLFQRGSAESKDPDKSDEMDEHSVSRADRSDIPLPVRKGGLILMLYNHSLSLAFMLLFAISFAGHAVCGAQAYNKEAAEHGRNAISVWQYLSTSQFWFESFQNWQSEFLAIFSIVVLSIWLREKGSPESKPVAAAYSETGG
jgi:hypothetical protein